LRFFFWLIFSLFVGKVEKGELRFLVEALIRRMSISRIASHEIGLICGI
jgi:hypothetical protein